MPNVTAEVLYAAAFHIDIHGLHTGDQFIAPDHTVSVCAAIYHAAEGSRPPEFYADADAAATLIAASAPAMQAIRALSDALDTPAGTDEIAPGVDIPDYIDHVTHWASTAAIGRDRPPTDLEVIGRILRTANALRIAARTAA